MRKHSALFVIAIAKVGNGRVQKFIPRTGARPELLVGKPPVPRS